MSQDRFHSIDNRKLWKYRHLRPYEQIEQYCKDNNLDLITFEPKKQVVKPKPKEMSKKELMLHYCIFIGIIIVILAFIVMRLLGL